MLSDRARLQRDFYNWPQRFNAKTVRKGIVSAIHSTICSPDSCLLKPFAPANSFAAMLLAYLPEAHSLLPANLASDSELKDARELLEEFSRNHPDEIWKSDQTAAFAMSLLILQSRGVKSLDFGYLGGWDETSYDGVDDVAWLDSALPPELQQEFADRPDAKSEFAAELFSHIKAETGVTDHDIFYHFLDDTGAGDGRIYSQGMLLDMGTLEFVLHDYDLQEEEEDQEESD